MKICLVGPSCAGKTTLANKLKKISGHNCLDLDRVFVDEFKPRKVGEIFYRSKEDGEKIINDFFKKNKDWIIEGVFPVWSVFKNADIIIFMKPSFVILIFRQWYRFFSDEFQRRTFGFKTNLTFLTPDIVKQYFSRRGCNDLKDPVEFSVKKYEQILDNFRDKTIKVGVVNYGVERDILDRVALNGKRNGCVR
ncbi:hypothetical protein KKD37_03495 [Patescibacteria group bacterium]|nr:hypothetical protein [Patescibacteria group bacterium]